MAEQYYIRAKGMEAVRTYHQVVARKRKELSRKEAGPFGRIPVPAQGKCWT
jgi:hypothetical protein